MKILNSISEDEMISIFLKAEMYSVDYKTAFDMLLGQHHLNQTIIDSPNLTNSEDNAFRKHALSIIRGYKKNKLFFAEFPNSVRWVRVILTKDELKKVKFINSPPWNRLTPRSPTVLARKIEHGEIADSEDTRIIKSIASSLIKGVDIPELIFVAKNETSPLVVFEGHKRLTALFLSHRSFKELEVVIGYSTGIEKWTYF